MKIGNNCIELKSGRVAYAQGGCLGLDQDGNLIHGWTDAIGTATFTAAERAEIADHMIEQWKKFKSAK